MVLETKRPQKKAFVISHTPWLQQTLQTTTHWMGWRPLLPTLFKPRQQEQEGDDGAAPRRR
jgi:hypothetical protein